MQGARLPGRLAELLDPVDQTTDDVAGRRTRSASRRRRAGTPHRRSVRRAWAPVMISRARKPGSHSTSTEWPRVVECAVQPFGVRPGVLLGDADEHREGQAGGGLGVVLGAGQAVELGAGERVTSGHPHPPDVGAGLAPATVSRPRSAAWSCAGPSMSGRVGPTDPHRVGDRVLAVPWAALRRLPILAIAKTSDEDHQREADQQTRAAPATEGFGHRRPTGQGLQRH